MAYCDKADLLEQLDERELVQLTDDDGLGVVDPGVIESAITDAGGEIDGYLGGRYPVPLDPVPAIIRKLAVDIAIYNLHARRLGPPEHREARYRNAIRFLEKVASGRIGLGASDPDPVPCSQAPRFNAPGRIFSRETLKDC